MEEKIVTGSKRPEAWQESLFKPTNLFVILTLVNLLNYTDRGIIPGSTNEFNKFISETIDTDTPDVFLGLLQSAFIVGFSLASVIFGHAVHFYPPFFLCSCGLTIWMVAVTFSGLSYWFDSYLFLLLSRMLSGCGEASFQCSVPPWIQITAEEGSKAKWISLFYTAIPVGTAIGYVYSSLVSSSIGWPWAFILEAVAMAPFVLFLFAASPFYPSLTTTLLRHGNAKNQSETTDQDEEEGADAEGRLKQDLLTEDERRVAVASQAAGDTNRGSLGDASSALDAKEDRKQEIREAKEAPTILEELRAVFSRPIYVLIALGYAAQTGALIGISTFGSAFLMGLGFFDSETEASSAFGVLVSLSGIVGTLLGGYLLDRSISHYQGKVNEEKKDGDGERVSLTSQEEDAEGSQALTEKEQELVQVRAATSMISWVSVGCALLMWAVYFVRSKELFMIIIGSGCALAFLATPGINIGAMNAVPMKNRAFCMAMMSVTIHALGDVPSPVIAGLLKDHLAPKCNGVDASSDQCREDAPGLRLTMLIVCSWFLWCIVCFGLARFIAGLGPEWRNDLEENKEEESSNTMRAPRDLGNTETKNPVVRGSSADRLANKSEDSFTF